MNNKYSKTNSEIMKESIKKPVCMGSLTKEELDAELDKGYQEAILGKGRLAEDVFNDMRRDYKF